MVHPCIPDHWLGTFRWLLKLVAQYSRTWYKRDDSDMPRICLKKTTKANQNLNSQGRKKLYIELNYSATGMIAFQLFPCPPLIVGAHAPAYDVFFARLLSCSPSETGQVNEQTLMASSDLTRSEVKFSTGQTRRWGIILPFRSL